MIKIRTTWHELSYGGDGWWRWRAEAENKRRTAEAECNVKALSSLDTLRHLVMAGESGLRGKR